MSNITFEMITVNLHETIENLDYLEKDGFTDFLSNLFYDIYEIIKEIALEIIDSGQPTSEIPLNVGKYAMMKMTGVPIFSYDRGIWIADYGHISHGLGKLTGDLYNGVANQPMGIVTVTRGKEVAIHTNFNNPSYIGDVHSGKPGVVPRPFMDVATRRVEAVLTQAVEEYLRSVNITSPPPNFIASLIVKNAFRDLYVY